MDARTISEAAAAAGVSTDTLRYYERLGLLSPQSRTASGYRLYGTSVSRRVRFIKGAQRMGLRLQEIKDLLEVSDRGACPCGHTHALLTQRRDQVDAELARLRALRQDLTAMLEGLDDCAPAPVGVWWCETEFAKRGGDTR